MTMLSVYETAKDSSEQIKKIDPVQRMQKDGKNLACTITVNAAETFQSFEGFGGALTESSGYVLSRMPEEVRQQAIDAYFSRTTGNAYRIARIHMNSCDFSLGNWACVPERDETLDSFSMERTDKYITPLARAAEKSFGGGLSFLLSPWSPPAWMKDNNDMNHGGHLLPQYRALWAKYFVRFIKAMQERGIRIDYVTVQNEAAAKQIWDSCLWSAEEEGEFAVRYLGPELEKEGLGNVKIYIWDHNRDLALERMDASMAVAGASKYIAGIAYHWYSGDQYENIREIARKYPDKDIMFSEGCVEGGPRNGAWFTGERYAHNIINDLNSGATKWIDWNIVLDMEGGPNHVGNMCDAPILADGKTGKLYFQSSYYYIGHFSRFIQNGAKRLETQLSSSMTPATVSGHLTNEMESLAYKNPDGTLTLVVMNRTEADMVFNLDVRGAGNNALHRTALRCPPRAIQTWLFAPSL